MRIACFRGLHSSQISVKGSMAAVGLSAEAARAYLNRITMGKVAIACINSPSSVTLSGDVEGIDEVLGLLQADNVFARKLRVSTAYHSHHMESISEEYLASLEGVWEAKSGHADVKMFSSVRGEVIDGKELGPSYWIANMVSPVNFSGAVMAASKSGSLGKRGKVTGKRGSQDAIVEIGPHAALQGPLKQILDSVGDAATAPRYFSAIKRKQDAVHTTLQVVGELLLLGHSVNVPLLNAYADAKSDGSKISALVDLPPYAWNTSNRYWHESAAVSSYKNRKHPRLELLGARDEWSTDAEPSWRNYLRVLEQPWIEQHKFQNANIYPMAGLIVMAIEATRQVETRADVSGYEIRNVNVRNALVVPLNETIETKLQLSPWRPGPNASSSHWTEFKVSSRNESGVWTANCTGLITTLYKQEQARNTAFIDEEATENSELRREHEKMMQEGWPSLDPDEFYSKVNQSGFTLGPVFRGITKLHVHNYKSHFSMDVLDTKQWYPSKWEPPHLIHPAVLDVFVHVLISGAGNIAQINARIPVSAASLYISADFDSAAGTRYHGFTSSKTHGVDGLVTDIVTFGEDGEKPLIALRGCQTVPLRNESEELSSDGQYIGHVPIVPHLSPDIDVAPVTELQKLLQGKDLTTTLGHYISLIACKRPALEIMEFNPSKTNLLREALALRAGDLTIDSIKSVVMASELDELIEESPSPSDTLNKVIHNRKLDVLEDFASQGFQDGTYDIVISTLACEHSGDFSAILAGFKKLLKPCEVLLITGGFNTSASTDEALASAGFTSTKVKISNSPDLIISHQKPEPENQVRNVVMVTPQDPSDGLRKALKKVSRELEAQNYTVSRAPFGSITQQASPYLALITLDVDSSFLESLDDYSFTKLRSLILGSSGTLWLTLDTYSRGLVKGFGRTIRAEHPDIPFVIMAIELHTSPDVEGNVFHIIRLLQNISNKNLGESTDSEYVIRGGLPFTERLLADAKLKSLMDASKSCQMLPVAEIPFHQATKVLRLSVREPGLLGTLEYVPVPGMSQGPIVDGQMEIEVTSVGLNFRDVMVAMGQMEDSNLGVECAGIVSRVGLGVEKFRVGDRVFGLHSGCFQTRVQVDPRTFERTPHDLSDEQAASLMCIYATVVRSLIDVARLERGESVLIHSAAGGVGQAAIRVAQFIGAEIFATVSSEKKKRFLVEKCGIQESHIFNSRDHSFADGILRLTKQRGVDVVLNSLAQEALRRTWLCVAPFGRFIELGKRDIYDNTGLEMRPFLNNITFAGVDILCQVKDYPDRIEKTNKKVVELLHKGAIAPLSDLMEYSFGEAEKAFRLMQSGGHIGKIVLSPRQDDVIPIVPEGLMSFQLPHNRSYILVGGLGGIGRSIAKMLVKQGARHLVFLSRSGSSRPEAAALLCEIQKQGGSATAISVDVADKPQLEAALKELVQTFPPIQGLIHCAMNLRDGIYENMSASDWNLSLNPKLRATRNLHELLPENLDFFVCLSSIAGIIGSRGQANYNAGNTYQDALMHYRAASGLAGTSINLSLVVGIGVSTERGEVLQLLKNGGLLGMDETDVLNVVAAAVSGRAPTQVAIGASTGGQLDKSSSSNPYWFSDSRFAFHNQLDRRSDGANSTADAAQDFKKLLAAAASKDELFDIAFSHLIAGVSKIIKTDPEDMDTKKSLPALGIDSLIAIEIRTWLSKEFQADVSVFDIVSSDPLPIFAKKLIEKSSLIPASRN